MKILNGAELAGYMKENQAHQVRSLQAKKIQPKLVIIRDSNQPVIAKYVKLKQKYGEDIGITVEDWLVKDIAEAIERANRDDDVHGIIVQLPLQNVEQTDEIVPKIIPPKDVDGLATDIHLVNNPENHYSSGDIKFESATATAINWLLAGYDIKMVGRRVAIVGHGRLVGGPLERMWQNSGYDVRVFDKGDDLYELKNFDIVVSATGVPHLIKNDMVKTGAVVVDAGTASEGGVLVGDIEDAVRERKDLSAITPKIGGVGPLTVTALFEHVLIAASKSARAKINR